MNSVNDKCGGCTLAYRTNRCTDVLRAMNMIAKNMPITTKMRYGMVQGDRTSHYLMNKLLDVGSTQLITLHPRSRFFFFNFYVLTLLIIESKDILN